MKNFGLLLIFAVGLCANAQDKPRVFVQGKGSENVSTNGAAGGGRHWATWGSKSTIDAHDESMEVTKDLQKNCTGVMLTINQSNADYIVMMNRESKQNRGLLRSNSQVQVANKMGDVITTSATHTVGNAAKDACNAIVADWQAHGPIKAQETTPVPSAQPASVKAAVATSPGAETVPAVQATAAKSTPTIKPAAQSDNDSAAASSSDDATPKLTPAEAAKREKQRKACLELAKDNPSITCK
ncbi:MAG TPA: hypothetical protein VFB28_11890 [Terriglobales bacterium]|nr:hypothetical protein [Terriglobales bacterium]